MKQKQKIATETAGVQATTSQCQVHALFDSSQWPPSAVMNHNHIYFDNIDEFFCMGYSRDLARYQLSQVKPGFQLFYLEGDSDYSVKAVNFDTLYIYAIELYDLDWNCDGYTIYFRCRDSLDFYTLFYPLALLCKNKQTDNETVEYELLAWKNIITEEEINQKPSGWTRIYNSRITKLANLGF